MQFVVASPWESVEEAYAMINRDVAALAADERVRLGIERVEDRALIGICTLFDFDTECRIADI